MRQKKRYIVFQARGEPLLEREAKDGIFAFLVRFFGEHGYSKLGYKFLQYEPATGFGLARCERASLQELLGAFALMDNVGGKKTRVIALSSSGTVKTLRERGFSFIKEEG